MKKVNEFYRQTLFAVQCFILTGMTPKKILGFAARLTDCHLPGTVHLSEVGVHISAFGTNVMVYGDDYTFAINFTEKRGLAIQYTTDLENWEEGYRPMQYFIDCTPWICEFKRLPKVTRAAVEYSKQKGGLRAVPQEMLGRII